MVSSEVKRTLVKSPPELWAELSDPAVLARHLSDLGDVGDMRITRTHAEERVDWEADGISGTVLMKASGWGTKVTLRVSREAGKVEAPAMTEPPATDDASTDETEDTPTQDAKAVDLQAETEPDNVVKGEPAHLSATLKPETPSPSADEGEATPTTPTEPPLAEVHAPSLEEVLSTTSAMEPRGGFFSRFFRRRRPMALSNPSEATGGEEPSRALDDRGQPERPNALTEIFAAPDTPGDPAPRATAEASPIQDEVTIALADGATGIWTRDCEGDEPATASDQVTEAAPDLSAVLQAAQAVAAEEVTAVLTATLDRLGAAHHRPFSRA